MWTGLPLSRASSGRGSRAAGRGGAADAGWAEDNKESSLSSKSIARSGGTETKSQFCSSSHVHVYGQWLQVTEGPTSRYNMAAARQHKAKKTCVNASARRLNGCGYMLISINTSVVTEEDSEKLQLPGPN